MDNTNTRIRSYLDWLQEKAYKTDSKVDLAQVKEHITRYQVTRYKDHFATVLELTDNLIIHTILKLRNRSKYLQRYPAQELYHVGILGLAEALNVIPPECAPEKIPMWIVAYVKSNIRKEFGHFDNQAESIEENDKEIEDKKEHYKENGSIAIYDYDLDTLEKMEVITTIEKKILVAFYLDGKQRRLIAKKFRVGESTISYRMKGALVRIKAFFVTNRNK